MKKKIISAIIIVTSFTLLAAEDFRLLSEQNPPFSFLNKTDVQGMAVELLDEILKNTGRRESIENIEYLPWARSYKIIQENPGTILFPMAKTAVREKLFKWVGPIYNLQIGIIARKDSDITINSIEDLEHYIVGTVRDGAPEQLLLDAGTNINNLERVTSIELNLKKLVFGRINMLAYNVPSALYNLKLMGEDLNNYEVVYIIKELGLYYGFHISTDPLIIELLQKALDNQKETGGYDRITAKYFGTLP